MTTREWTGRDVALVTVGAFALIIGVNVTMAVQAIRTFPGLEVANSYVASQSFDADARAQQALGWSVEAGLDRGLLTLQFPADGGPVDVTGLFGRATAAAQDQGLTFTETAPGQWQANVAAGDGRWVLHLTAKAADGTAFRQRLTLREGHE